jgi:hypothetical protein
MKQADFIRLGILAIAFLLANQAVPATMAFLIGLFSIIAYGNEYGTGGSGLLSILLKVICLAAASCLLVYKSRKISNNIEAHN